MNATQRKDLRERIARLERERAARSRTPDLLRRLLLAAARSRKTAAEDAELETMSAGENVP